MRPRQITGWLTPLAAVALVLACGPAQAPAAVCVTVTPGIDLGCRDEQGAPAGGEPTASSEPSGAPTEPEPTRRNSTVVRYDPRQTCGRCRRHDHLGAGDARRRWNEHRNRLDRCGAAWWWKQCGRLDRNRSVRPVRDVPVGRFGSARVGLRFRHRSRLTVSRPQSDCRSLVAAPLRAHRTALATRSAPPSRRPVSYTRSPSSRSRGSACCSSRFSGS